VLKPEAAELIAAKAWNPLFGARGVRRQMQDLVETPLAKRLLANDLKPGDQLTIGVKNDEIILSKRAAHARASAHNR